MKLVRGLQALWARVCADARRYYRAVATLCFGFDFFVSYSRGDGAPYARDLQQRLEDQGYVVAFDESDLLPGDPLTESLRNRVKRSRYLLLVDTPRARLESRYVAQEVDIALTRGGRLVRISSPQQMTLRIDGSPPTNAAWTYLKPETEARLKDAIGVDDPVGVSSAGVQPGVVTAILKTRTRRSVRRRLAQAASIAACVFALAVAVTVCYRWGNALSADAGKLADSGSSDLMTFYTQAERLASRAGLAWRVRLPFFLHDNLAADIQSPLRKALLTRMRPLPRAIEVDPDSSDRLPAVVLADEGRLVFSRFLGGIRLSRIDSPSTRGGEVPELGLQRDLRAWGARHDSGVATVTLAYDDRFETWSSHGDQWRLDTRCAVSALPDPKAAIHAISARLAIAATERRLWVIATTTCSSKWSVPMRGTLEVLALLDDRDGNELITYSASPTSERHLVVALFPSDVPMPAPQEQSFEVAKSSSGDRLWAYSPVSRLLAFTNGSKVSLVEPRNRSSEPRELNPGEAARRLDFSPDGKLLAVSTEYEIRVWRTAQDKETADAGATTATGALTPAVFGGKRTVVYVVDHDSDLELRSLVVPDGVMLTPFRPAEKSTVRRLHAQGATIAIESVRTEAQVSVTGRIVHAVGRVEFFKQAFDDLTDLKLASEQSDSAWREPQRLQAVNDGHLDQDLIAHKPCRWTESRSYIVFACSNGVRVSRKSWWFRGGGRARWFDVPSETTGERELEGVSFNDDDRSITLRYSGFSVRQVESKESIAITFPLEFSSLSSTFLNLLKPVTGT